MPSLGLSLSLSSLRQSMQGLVALRQAELAIAGRDGGDILPE